MFPTSFSTNIALRAGVLTPLSDGVQGSVQLVPNDTSEDQVGTNGAAVGTGAGGGIATATAAVTIGGTAILSGFKVSGYRTCTGGRD